MDETGADKEGFPLSANGPAYTSSEDRNGVPLVYVAEKLGNAIRELHRYGRKNMDGRDELVPSMYYLLVAYLGLHNMLGAANDHRLAPRLVKGSTKKLDAWLELVAREGDVRGLAGLSREGLE